MMKLIEQNPFRILGIAVNASEKEKSGNLGKKKLLEIGKEITFPLDLPAVFPPLNRTAADMDNANTAINLSQDKVPHALFWFAQPKSPIGKLGYERLLEGDTALAINHFSRGTLWEEKLCLSVLYLQDGQFAEGLLCIADVIDNHCHDFCMAIAGQTYTATPDDLRQQYLSMLISEVDVLTILNAMQGNDALQSFTDQLNQIAIEGPANAIESALASAKAVDDNDAHAQLRAGKALIEATKQPLVTLKKLVGVNDSRYSRRADKVAGQILQHSINYHNTLSQSTSDPLPVRVIDQCLQLAEYAEKICVGRLTKERVTKSADILREKKKNMPPAEVEVEAAAIMKAIRVFVQQPDLIKHSVTLLSTCKPHLQSMRAKLGETNQFYLKLSTQVVGNALHNLIEEVNAAQESELLELNGKKYRISSEKTFAAVRAAWKCTQVMEDFDMESDFRTQRFIPNRNTLRGMYNSLEESASRSSGTSSHPYSSPYSGSTSSSTVSSSGSSISDFLSDNLGCLIWLAIIGIIALISQCS